MRTLFSDRRVDELSESTYHSYKGEKHLLGRSMDVGNRKFVFASLAAFHYWKPR